MKRATQDTNPAALKCLYFNPRPREEGDCNLYDSFVSVVYFNPRPREEGDVLHLLLRTPSSDFNPRPREEGDNNLAVTVEKL